MLGWEEVISYVKDNLALPSTFIEDTDEEMKQYILKTAHKEFSSLFPDVAVTGITMANPDFKHPTLNSHYFFYDDENLPIMGIRECYFGQFGTLATGHPYAGPLSMGSAKWWALSVFKSRFVNAFSDFNYTYQFKPPNIIHILQTQFSVENDTLGIEYERIHPYDLRTIPVALSLDYQDLCLAHYQIKLGNLRSHYGNIQTPFGEVPLKGDELKNEGRELRREVVDRLRGETIPPVVIDIE